MECRIDNFEANLPRMKEMLKKLEHEYDIYFSGERRFPPQNEHKELERVVTYYSRSSLPTTAQQYLFMNFQQSWSIRANKWKKLLELKLNGITKDPRLVQVAREEQKKFEDLEKARSDDIRKEREAEGGKQGLRLLPPLEEKKTAESPVKALFAEYSRAKMEQGQTLDLDPKGFEKKLEKQRKELIEKYKAKDVVFTVAATGGKVSLKAKVIKSKG